MTQHEHPFHYYRSPEEIREIQFSHRVRGLDEYEVSEYLALLADQVHATNLEMARLREERDYLLRENESLRTENRRTPVPAPSYSPPEPQPQAASLLLNAQRVADDLVEEAVRRARDMLTVARAEKNAILRHAQEEAAALLVEARGTTLPTLAPARVRSSGSRHSAGSLPASLPAAPLPAASLPAAPAPPASANAAPAHVATVHLASHRTWQLDRHAVI